MYSSIFVSYRESEGLIYDSSEQYAMNLWNKYIMTCAGDYALDQGIKDLQKVVRQTYLEALEKKRTLPSSRESRKRKRLAKESSSK